MIAKAHQNEMLDALVWRVFGENSPPIEEVMALNPNLAGIYFLPEGQEVKLPEPETIKTPTLKTIQLWD
jgi:phage tail protein X